MKGLGLNMNKEINIGDKFGRLTVLEELEQRKRGMKVYKCQCECGNIVSVIGVNLTHGFTKSCGCYHKDRASEANKTHGESHTKLYYVWQDMRKRCTNPNHHAYEYYGGRGITVCDEWLNSYEAFQEWALNNGYEQGLTIDRENNNEGYSPDNCRWVTMLVQSHNQRPRKDMTLSNSPNAKPVDMYSIDGQFIKHYDSIKEACIDNDIKGTGSNISACCRGRQKIAHGYMWRYTNE